MNTSSVPEILTDETLFTDTAALAADHIMRQPRYIRQPIAAYGAFVAADKPAGREPLVAFLHALCDAQVGPWTNQLRDPAYVDDLDRLENTIALNVYLAQSAQDQDTQPIT